MPRNTSGQPQAQRSPVSAQFLQKDKVQSNRYTVVTGSGLASFFRCFCVQSIIYKVLIISKEQWTFERYSSIFYSFCLNGVAEGCGAYPSRLPETGGERYEEKRPYTLSVTPQVSLESPVDQSGLGEVAGESPCRPGLRQITKIPTYHSVIFAGVLFLSLRI